MRGNETVAEPKYRWIRWIAEVGEAHPAEVRERLYSTFYLTLTPIIFASINNIMVSTVAYLRSANSIFLWLVLADILLLLQRSRARKRWGHPSDGVFVGGICWALLTASITVVILLSGDQAMTIVALASNFATVAGILSHNFAAPRYAFTQGVIIILGFEIPMAFVQVDLIPLFVLQGIMFLIVGLGIVRQQRTSTIQALEREMSERERALKDPLTGLLNRRGLDQVFSCRSAEDPNLCLLYLDLDGFKEVNDRYGHGVGDDLLKQVGARLSEAVPEGSEICRLGGDEFLVLASEADDREIKILGTRLCVRIATPFQVDEALLVRVGVSIGVARREAGTATLADCMARADLALYEAKRRGKNTCVLHGSIAESPVTLTA